jgi:hypothetical protein
LGLGRLHETFRFISVTRFRTVSRTPWTGDQLVARPLLTVPGDCENGEVGGMKVLEGETDVTLSTISQRINTSAMARPIYIYIYIYIQDVHFAGLLDVQNILSTDTGISREIEGHSFGDYLIGESVSVTPSSVTEASIVLCSVSL